MNYMTTERAMLSKAGLSGSSSAGTTYSTTHRERSVNFATLTFASAHQMSVGRYVIISGLGGTGYNGYFKISDIPAANKITYANTGTNESTIADANGRVNDFVYYQWIDVDPSMTLAQVQSRIDKVSARIHGHLYVQFADGTYNWTGPLMIRSIRSRGAIILSGNSTETLNVRYTTQAVHLNFSGPQGILFDDLSYGYALRLKVTFASSSEDGYGIKARNCNQFFVYGCFVTGTSSNYGACIQSESSMGYGYYTVCSNARYAVHAKEKSNILTYEMGGAAPGLGTYFRSENASHLACHVTPVSNYTTRESRGTYVAPWKPSTAYSLGDYCSRRIPTGFKYECTRAGTSGSSEPSFPNSAGATVDDPDGSGAQWTARTDNTVAYYATFI